MPIGSNFSKSTNNVIQQNIVAGGIIGNNPLASVAGVLSPSLARLSVAGLFFGGEPVLSNSPNMNGSPNDLLVRYSDVYGKTQDDMDWRVRISLPSAADYFINSPQMSPLLKDGQSTMGVVFPYIPQITVTHSASYSQQKLTHTNYASLFYEHSEVADIQINGDFTVQNIQEGQYLMAAIFFFRSATKMFYGSGPHVGNPPPVMFLDGFGTDYFPHVPVVIKSFTHTMPPDVDYIEVPYVDASYNPLTERANSYSTRLPTTSQIQLTVQPVYSRINQTQRFNLKDFSDGKLFSRAGRPGGGDIGGFI